VATPASNPVRLVGRESELAALDEFMSAEDPTAHALVLRGGPGIGKTSLWQAAVNSARDRGFTVLTARPSESEAQLSYAALSDVLESVDGAAFAALPHPQRHALDVALLRSEPSDRPPEARAIAAAFLGVLRELAAKRPVLVAVDDVQWLDTASASALRFAQRRMSDLPVAFLATERSGSPRLGSEGVQFLEVGGLSIGAIRVVLAERLDFQPTRTLLRRLYESAQGNPLFTLELARTIRESGQPVSPDQPLAVPTELGTLLERRLARLSEGAKAAALAAALISEPSAELLETVLGSDATSSLAELREAGVVEVFAGRIRFTHPLMASTVTASASSGQRRAMERTLAGVIDDPVTSARHLALGASEPDEEVAQVLHRAALVALARGGWDSAAELLERASTLTPDEYADQSWRRAMTAAEYHAHTGDRVRARALLEELLLRDSVPRSDRANALRLRAEISRDDENFAGAISMYKQALEYVDDPITQVVIELGLAYVCSTSWQLEDAHVHGYRALQIVEARENDSLTSAALATCAMVDWQLGRGVDWDKLERALALEDEDLVMPLLGRTSTIGALLELYTGKHTEARARMTAILTRAADEGEQGDLAIMLTWFSWLETRAGSFEAAGSLADQAEASAAATGGEAARAFAQAQRAFVYAHQGDVERARTLCAVADAAGERAGFLLARLWGCATRAALELSVGNADAAWASSEEFTALVEALVIGEPVLVFFLPDAIEALISLGELDRADGLVSWLQARGRELDGAWAIATGTRCRGLLMAASGDFAGAKRAFADALREHERLDMPFERARTLLAKGIVERRAKQRANARASISEALDEFEPLGAQLWAERARDELSRVSGRKPRATGELTTTEQRVAELAAAGLSNKEIADALFVSAHTVETHLSHVYQKLGVRSRSQLTSRLSDPQ
jgi:DNA-binding CsgD family transcriptional regulator